VREPGRTADPSATPDFLLILMALADFMRFSPAENRTRGCVQCNVAGNPGALGMTKGRAVTFIRSLQIGWTERHSASRAVIPLKPKYGLNGAPSICCR
jgi:hypothetical protein